MEGLQKIEKDIHSAKNLQSIVGTMKAHASSNIAQFQRAAKASWEYKEVLNKSLHIVLSEDEQFQNQENVEGRSLHIIFGSDHGLAGRFNERIANYGVKNLAKNENNMSIIIGQQVLQRIQMDLEVLGFFNVPHTTENITSKVNDLLLRIDELRDEYPIERILLHYNIPLDRANFEEESEILFPIDLKAYSQKIIEWDSNQIPTYFTNKEAIISSLIQQYFFITLYRAFCYSLASENASRLSSMQSAEKNIEERLVELNYKYRRERQNSITEELNDIISGFKVISKSK